MVQEIRALLTARKLLVAKLRDVESSLRGILRCFGLKVGAVSKGKFEARIRELVAGQAMLERIADGGGLPTARGQRADLLSLEAAVRRHGRGRAAAAAPSRGGEPQTQATRG